MNLRLIEEHAKMLKLLRDIRKCGYEYPNFNEISEFLKEAEKPWAQELSGPGAERLFRGYYCKLQQSIVSRGAQPAMSQKNND